MSSPPAHRLTACPLCDLELELPELEQGEKAVCPRCHATLAKRCKEDWQRVASFALTAAIALAAALSFPFLRLQSAGGDSVTTIADAALALVDARPYLALTVGLLFIVVPVVQTVAILCLSFAFLSGPPRRDWSYVARLVEKLQLWSMADVFLVGTLVSLIKIVALAHLTFGLSFWAFVIHVIFITAAYSSLDTTQAFNVLQRRANHA